MGLYPSYTALFCHPHLPSQLRWSIRWCISNYTATYEGQEIGDYEGEDLRGVMIVQIQVRAANEWTLQAARLQGWGGMATTVEVK